MGIVSREAGLVSRQCPPWAEAHRHEGGGREHGDVHADGGKGRDRPAYEGHQVPWARRVPGRSVEPFAPPSRYDTGQPCGAS